MPLPKVPTVVYEARIPGKEQPIRYRPFLMKEYKSLLAAKELGDENAFSNTISETIHNCLIDEIDIDSLPMYTIDFLFLLLRAKSVSDVVEAFYMCNNPVEKEGVDGLHACGARINIAIQLDKATIEFPEGYNQKAVIELSDSIGLKLKSPTFKDFRNAQRADGPFEVTDEYMFSCIESVYEGDKIMVPGKDFDVDEMRSFLDAFPASAVQEITDFFANQPMVALDLEVQCPACGHTDVIELRGLDDFFA